MYADIVPDALQTVLLGLRDRRTHDAWLIADITRQVIEFNEANGREIETMLIYSAVGMFAGKASRTIREYYSVGQFFEVEIREQFAVLSFDHFRIAARLGSEKAIQALQWAVEQGDELNRPATVDAMEAKFLAVSDPPQPEDDPEEEKEPEGTIKQIYRLSTQILSLSGAWKVDDGDLQRAVSRLNKSCLEVADLCESLLAEEAG